MTFFNMAKLFFSLRGVPEDEAEEVRQLLEEHVIDYYETSAGNWGVSMPAIWLKNEAQWEKANELMHQYQQQRAIEQRALYEELKRTGQHRTILDVAKEKPATLLLYLGFCVFILYISMKLIVDFGF